jgi:hypothetical protein
MALATVESLTLIETPCFEQLSAWWEDMWQDPTVLQLAFSDLMPRSLSTFLEKDVQIVLVTVEATCATAFWVHDLEREDGRVTAGWIGAWIAPAWRGRIGLAGMHRAIAWFQAQGITHFYSAIHHAHRASIACTINRSMLGFTRVMTAPAFLPFRGTWTDCVISTKYPEDVERARVAVRTRMVQIARQVGRDTPRVHD